jgi:hypothetical protein
MFSANTSQVAAGGGGANYIEDVFSTYLYTGTGSAQTITNGVDLSTKGGLVWVKNRSSAVLPFLFDTNRGMGFASQSPFLSTNSTDAQTDAGTNYIRADTTGFSYGSSASGSGVNAAPNNYASWTFREQPKFFDVVTAARVPGEANGRISHNLGSVPGFVIVKAIDYSGESWRCYHRSLGRNSTIQLSSTAAEFVFTNYWGTSDPTSTDFGINWTLFSGDNYVFYFFAHDAGGFGLTGTDNVISCGSFTTDGSGDATVNLGYEPQWILQKCISRAGDNWIIIDDMRSFTTSRTTTRPLFPNTSGAEQASTFMRKNTPTSDGFQANQEGTDQTFIYVAIRRGPMKVPTDATKVFAPTLATGGGTATNPTYPSGFPVDAIIRSYKPGGYSFFPMAMDRLRGASPYLVTSSTAAEVPDTGWRFDSMTGFYEPGGGPNSNVIGWLFQRAPSFFDEVCYTGSGVARTVTHNLGAVPEFMIVKVRSTSSVNWSCYHSALGNTQVISLNEDIQAYTNSQWNNTTPTSTVFSVGTQTNVNGSGQTYVAYLFATCAGVSKVGSYTGTATTKQIDCGFTGGARFVLIKRTDEVASGNPWYVWDSARGIVSGNDPYLLLNSTAAEVTNTDYIDTYSAGFEISSTAPAAINASGGTFIFLAIS